MYPRCFPYSSTVQQPCCTCTPAFRSSCTTFVDLKKKPEYEMSMTCTFPPINLTETNNFTKFCTKYLLDSNHTREGTWSGSAAKTKQCRRTHAHAHTRARAKFYCTILNMRSLFQRIQINIIKEGQLKTESRRTASVTDHAQYPLFAQHNSPHTLTMR